MHKSLCSTIDANRLNLFDFLGSSETSWQPSPRALYCASPQGFSVLFKSLIRWRGVRQGHL